MTLTPKQTYSKVITLRITPSMYAKLKADAKKYKVSIPEVVRYCVENKVEE